MYHTTSKGIAALGRNGDDTLLHVKKDELAGLEQLLGPVTVNPNTGLPEAFSWTDILTSLGIGILGAATGGAAAPALGAIGSTVVGAGTGALAGGTLSAMQGRGFGPGALGGAISGGMGGYGAADIPGGPTAVSTATKGVGMDAVNLGQPIAGRVEGALAGGMGPGAPLQVGEFGALPVGVNKELAEVAMAEPIPSSLRQAPISSAPSFLDDYASNLSQTGSAMMTKPGMEHLLKPVGMGTLLGAGAEGMMEDASTSATQMRQEKLKQAIADKQQREYFASLGYDLPPSGTSWSPATQRKYFDDIIYGAAAGGPIEASRIVGGLPVQTTIPPKYVSQFEKTDLGETLGPAIENVRGITRGVAQNLGMQGYVTGGYINLNPEPPQGYYPMSQIASAHPYPAATPQRQEVIEGYGAGGSAYEKGGFLDGPGDGMSDDIPANIDGREEIRLADGEFVVPPEMVSLIGGGDPEEGKRLLDQLLPMVRQAAHGKKEQIKQDAGKLAAEKLLTRKKARGDARRSGIEAAG